jgi:hypothetical protein
MWYVVRRSSGIPGLGKPQNFRTSDNPTEIRTLYLWDTNLEFFLRCEPAEFAMFHPFTETKLQLKLCICVWRMAPY